VHALQILSVYYAKVVSYGVPFLESKGQKIELILLKRSKKVDVEKFESKVGCNCDVLVLVPYAFMHDLIDFFEGFRLQKLASGDNSEYGLEDRNDVLKAVLYVTCRNTRP
jgi:hypothetical protein